MTKDEIITDLRAQNAALQNQLDQLLKLIYGKKSERFISNITSEQLSIFANEETEIPPQPEKVKIQYERNKPKPHPGRNAIPEHLPVEEVIIEPEEDTTGLKKIGEEITETLEYTPASLVRKVTIRPKYAKAEGEGVLIAELPTRPIEKGMAEASLLSHILVSKFVDHLPYHRQIAMFKRDFDWILPQSTLIDWMSACCKLLWPLYEALKTSVLSGDYLQADESPIKVLDKDKKGKTHQGYMWVYHAPETKLVWFNYRKGRGHQGPKEVLVGYTGYLQCDGYQVYYTIADGKDITLVGCLAHTRRKFYEAQGSDPHRSAKALDVFKDIYLMEREIKSKTGDPVVRMAKRIDQIEPLLEDLFDWVKEEYIMVPPKSPIGKAMTYLQGQWPKLEAIFKDGRLELDNNLIENVIRPLAVGRKNYLFGGSHAGAERNAMMYSFMGSCKIQGINPREWLQNVLQRLPDHPVNRIEELLPNKNFAHSEKV